MQDVQPISVLIIDDNPGDQALLYEKLISTKLSIAGIQMADTLSQGIDQLKSGNFSLVFLDLFLPDSTGLESLSKLGEINARIPVIIYSGLSDTQIATNAIAMGAQDFLIKDEINITLLEKVVRYSIERKQYTVALEESNEKYNLISKVTHDMVWDWNLVTGKVYRNEEGWRKIFQSDPDKAVGLRDSWINRIIPEDRIHVNQVVGDAINNPAVNFFRVEFRVQRDDGSIGHVVDRGSIIRDESGTAVRIIGASHDITQRKAIETQVLESERRFRSLVQNGSDLLAILDVQGNYSYVSPSSTHILGFTPEDFIGKNAFDFIHPEDIPTTSAALAEAATKHYIKVPLFRFRNAAGDWRWIESTITNLSDDPAVKGIVVNSRDVTEKKNADDEIEKLSIIATQTMNGVIISDKDHKITWVNESFTRMFGYRLEEVIGKEPSEFLPGPETDMDVISDVQDQKISSKEPFSFEMLAYGKTGNKIFLHVLVQPILDEEGKLKQSFAMQSDITAKKEAEVELQKLSIIARETVNSVIIRDVAQRILWVNQGFTKMTGYELEEVLGRKPADFLRGPDSDNSIQAWVDEQREKHVPFVYEILNYTKSGEELYVRVQDQSIFNDAGQVVQYMAMVTDITQQKRVEEEIALQKVLKQKEITDAVYAAQEKERSEIGMEMHDNVNQLLGATRLYIDMARSNEKDRDSLLASASMYTMSAIEEIRKLSKTLITPHVKELGLINSITDLSSEIMQVDPINILVAAEGVVETGLKESFKLNVFRIVQEQLNNILKHAKAKHVVVDIRRADDKLMLSIKDDGVGFDTGTRRTGVGITNIKTRSELYNGMLDITSVQGAGTSLTAIFNMQDISIRE